MMTIRDFKKCPDNCPHAIDGWCRDDDYNYIHCPTIDKVWKRYVIGDFGEKIPAPKGVSEAEAKQQFYHRAKKALPVQKRKATINLYDED